MQFYQGKLDYLRSIISLNEESAPKPHIKKEWMWLQQHKQQWESREDFPLVRGVGMADQQYFERSEPCGYSHESIKQFLSRCGVEYNEVPWVHSDPEQNYMKLRLLKPVEYDDFVSGHNKLSLEIYPYDLAKAAHVVVTGKYGVKSEEHFDTKGQLFDILKKYKMFEEFCSVQGRSITHQQSREPLGSIESIEEYLHELRLEYRRDHLDRAHPTENNTFLHLTKGGHAGPSTIWSQLTIHPEKFLKGESERRQANLTSNHGYPYNFNTRGDLFNILNEYQMFQENY